MHINMKSIVGYYFVLFLICCYNNCCYAREVPSPPLITNQCLPNDFLFKKQGENNKLFHLECEAQGEPAPKYYWIKDGNKFDWQPYDDRISQQSGYGTLSFIKLSDVDVGQYQCLTENQYRIVTSSLVFLRQTELDFIRSTPSTLLAPPKDQRKIVPGRLIIEHLIKNDCGNYGCNATNSLGSAYKDVYDNVQALSPEITEGPTDTYAVDSQSVNITCKVIGTSRPTIKWIPKGHELIGGRFEVQESGGLLISDVQFEDGGNYICYGENKIHKASTIANLFIKVRRLEISNQPSFQQYIIKVIAVNDEGKSNVSPVEFICFPGKSEPELAPQNVNVRNVQSSTDAIVSWIPVTLDFVNGNFESYKNQICSDRSPVGNESGIQGGSSKVLVNSFVPNVKNCAQVYAYNGKYNGPPSETFSFHTPEVLGIPGEIESLEALPLGYSALLLKWGKPERPNGNLIGCNTYYTEVDNTLKVRRVIPRHPQIEDPNRFIAKLEAGDEVCAPM